MAAPEERDLTQEQTEKLLQFQVAASTRCNECCRGLGSGSLEEPRTLLRLGPRFVSNQQTAPSPPAANCPARCPRPPNLCLSPAFQGWLRPDLPSLSLIRGSALQVLLSGARPQPSFPTRILGPSPPTTLDPLRCLIPTVELASFRASVRAFHQFPMPFLQTFIEDFLGARSRVGRFGRVGPHPKGVGGHPKGVGGHLVLKQCSIVNVICAF